MIPGSPLVLVRKNAKGNRKNLKASDQLTQMVRQAASGKRNEYMSQGKNSTQVYIAGKVYTVEGYEEEDYLQKVAAYINTRISDLKKSGNFLRQGVDFFHVMVELNITDDYFKVRRHADQLEKKLDELEKELYGLKHDLVSVQMKLEKQEQETREWQSISEEMADQVEELKLKTGLAGNAGQSQEAQKAEGEDGIKEDGTGEDAAKEEGTSDQGGSGRTEG